MKIEEEKKKEKKESESTVNLIGIIKFRVSEKDEKKIRENAAASKMNLSTYVRVCCTDKQIIIIDELKEFTIELNRVGNNLNQITMLCHQGFISAPDLEEVKSTLKNVYTELLKIGKKVTCSKGKKV